MTEPIVALRSDRGQVIVTLVATGSTDAMAKAKMAARVAGHAINGRVAQLAINDPNAGSRKPAEWRVTLDLRAATPRQVAARTAVSPGVVTDPIGGAAEQLAGGQRTGIETEELEPIATGAIPIVEAVTGAPITPDKITDG